jgi:hypothetical protein
LKTLSIVASDSAIKSLVVEWSELLAQKNYQAALDLLPPGSDGRPWTAELLARAISGYGVLDSDPETLQMLHEEYEVSLFEISSLFDRDDRDEVINRIEVDRENLYGLDQKKYLGMVHYGDVPLCGYLSDLTAQFHIKRVDNDKLTLEFHDLHVM